MNETPSFTRGSWEIKRHGTPKLIHQQSKINLFQLHECPGLGAEAEKVLDLIGKAPGLLSLVDSLTQAWLNGCATGSPMGTHLMRELRELAPEAFKHAFDQAVSKQIGMIQLQWMISRPTKAQRAEMEAEAINRVKREWDLKD